MSLRHTHKRENEETMALHRNAGTVGAKTSPGTCGRSAFRALVAALAVTAAARAAYYTSPSIGTAPLSAQWEFTDDGSATAGGGSHTSPADTSTLTPAPGATATISPASGVTTPWLASYILSNGSTVGNGLWNLDATDTLTLALSTEGYRGLLTVGLDIYYLDFDGLAGDAPGLSGLPAGYTVNDPANGVDYLGPAAPDPFLDPRRNQLHLEWDAVYADGTLTLPISGGGSTTVIDSVVLYAAAVPEPGTMLLVAGGVTALWQSGRRRRRKA